MLAALTGAALATPPIFGVPGPEAGAALPMLAIGADVAWRARRNAR